MGKIVNVLIIILAVKLMCSLFFSEDVYYRYAADEFIKMHDYPVEFHYVTTSDGYILNLHRIPHGKHTKSRGEVVLLVHGLWTSSMLFLFAGPDRSLGFILADEGYDVWMLNSRGNEYSRNHTVLDPNDSEFWNFSWHEIGLYDLPASIDYILQQTNKTALYFSGLSEGSTVMYVMCSNLPEYNEKIKLYIHLAPVAFLDHAKSTFVTHPAAALGVIKETLSTANGIEMFAARGGIPQSLRQICSENIGKLICEKMYYAIGGYSIDESNVTLFSDAVGLAISGGSSKQVVHYLQLHMSGKFQQYDHGTSQNLLKYGQSTPPEYNLNKVTAPGYLIYASSDYISDNHTDVPRLYNSLGNCLGKILVPFSLNHIDFVLGMKAPSFVYSKMIELFSEHHG